MSEAEELERQARLREQEAAKLKEAADLARKAAAKEREARNNPPPLL